MQVRALAAVDAPIYYAMGNHEFDYLRYGARNAADFRIPMRERIANEPQWHTTANVDDWTFRVDFDGLTLFFFSDHCARDGRWAVTHCGLRLPNSAPEGASIPANPHSAGEARLQARAALEAIDRPFFTLSHNAFPGGNRGGEGPLQAELLPLPPNHVAHFYGHSHIGDRVWGGVNYLRQISTIDDSAATQFDIASLENRRGNAVRSAIVEWYGDGRYGVFFRNHTHARWEKVYLQNPL